MTDKKQEKTPKKRGRPKKTVYLPWAEAKEFIQKERIPSVNKYYEWYKKNQPAVIPKFPYRVYKEWTTWNDYLGSNNEFGKPLPNNWRPFEEAVLWVHTLGLKTMEDWLEYARNNKIPSDIPVRPDLVYKKEWKSWPYWTGKNLQQAIETRVRQEDKYIYYIIREPSISRHAKNILTFGIEKNGISTLRARWEREPFDTIGLYWYNAEKEQQLNNVLAAFSSPYYENERYRIVPNVHELLWYVDMLFEKIRF